MAKWLEHIYRGAAALSRRVIAVGACLLCLFFALYYFYCRQQVVQAYADEQVSAGVMLPGTGSRMARACGLSLSPFDGIRAVQQREGETEIRIKRAFSAQVYADGRRHTVYATGGTVGDMLRANGIYVGVDDYSEPPLHAAAEEGMEPITLHRVEFRDVQLDEHTPFTVEYEYTSLFYLFRNKQIIMRTGQDGYTQQTLREKYVDGEKVGSITLKTGAEHCAMVPQVVKVYGEGVPISKVEAPQGVTVTDNVPDGDYVLYPNMKATGYYSPRGRGSSGLGLYYGTFAVDPTLIPYGTKVYVVSPDGRFVYGWAIATDTGAFINSNRWQLDLFYETYAESAANGVQYVNVYVPASVADPEIAAAHAPQQ